MKKPNFFLVGAPKSGTTALCRYLGSHPDVFFSSPKEPLFFGRDLEHSWREHTNETEYAQLFRAATHHKRVGEGTVWYLYSLAAAEEIYKFNPDAKIVVILRNPVEAVYSLHSQFLATMNEDLTCFEEALEAQEMRRCGTRIPATAFFPWGLQYFHVYSYYEQVNRYLDTFGDKSVHIILFDELHQDKSGMCQRLLQFLDLPPFDSRYLKVANSNRTVIYPELRRLIKRTAPATARPLLAFVPHIAARKFLKDRSKSVLRKLASPTVKHETRRPMRPDTRERLSRQFEPNIRKLSELIRVDLSTWLT